ncbi:MAG: ribosome recycling factor [Candidatus Spechtbacterales bacterium]|nr:ribosome recycling factor [Candidatus Spechtbacterales bacterium]
MNDIKNKLEKTIENLGQELRSLRVGRANPGMVEDIKVNVYDSDMPLNQVASISIPQNNQILIQPWDAGNMEALQAAILKSDLGINPVAEGNSIRLTLPPMTEETRKDLVKEVHELGEEARVAIRNIREDAIKDLDKEDASEDEERQRKDEIQDIVNEYNKKVQELVDKKEKEVLEH